MDTAADVGALGSDRDEPTRPYEVVYSMALKLGKIGSRIPKDSPPHLDDARRTLWWSISWGTTSALRSDLELETELAWMKAMVHRVETSEAEQILAADVRALEWVLGTGDSPIDL